MGQPHAKGWRQAQVPDQSCQRCDLPRPQGEVEVQDAVEEYRGRSSKIGQPEWKILFYFNKDKDELNTSVKE